MAGMPLNLAPMFSKVANRAASNLRANPVGRKRIVFFDHTSKMSGGEIALLNLVTTLDTTRYEPVVVVCAAGQLVDNLRDSGIETHIVPLDSSIMDTRKETLGIASLLQLRKISISLGYSIALAKVLLMLDADLVHTNSLKSDIIGAFAAKIARVPIIWHVRDRIADDYLPGKVAQIFRWLCTFVPDHVITISQATRETLPKSGNKDARINRKVTIVHDGVAPSAVRPSERKWGSNDQVRIGIIGRLSPWKGQHVFLKAASRVHSSFPNVIFQIIGSAMFGEKPYEAELVRLVDELGLGECVEFLGFCDNVLDVIQNLDIVVHASTIGEPFGQVIVEGMACQKPVIATRGGGVPEIIQHDESGLLVPMNDENAMGQAMLDLLNNPQKARQIAVNGRKRVHAQFLIEHTARKIEKVYDSVLQNQRHKVKRSPTLP